MGAIKQEKPCFCQTLKRMAQLRQGVKHPLSHWYYKRTAIDQLSKEMLATVAGLSLPNVQDDRPPSGGPDHPLVRFVFSY